mmetsp:Transcript_22172/g.46476  ORF Transcript_22172/g.46476 Transcript_22172/m.46476 type:complete len:150 (+) Transcript_22172:191-640(+)
MEEPFARYFERKQLLVGAETGCLRSMQAAFTLIQADADVDQEDGRGASGLLLAAQNGHKKVARLLLQEGADEAKVTSCGFTPLGLPLLGVGMAKAAGSRATGAPPSCGSNPAVRCLGPPTQVGRCAFEHCLPRSDGGPQVVRAPSRAFC